MLKGKTFISHDDSLIISRHQQKELDAIKPAALRLHHIPPLTKLVLDPFLDKMPIKIGLEINLLGSRIMSLRIIRGFLFQNLENRLSELHFNNALMHIASLNQQTPIFYQLALVYAYEELFMVAKDEKTLALRAFLMEFSRIFHHWQVLKNMFITLECNDLADIASHAIKLMKNAHDNLGRIWVYEENSWSITVDELTELLEMLNSLTLELDTHVSFNKNLRRSLRKKASINLNTAGSFGLTGLFLRANRNPSDNRSPLLGYESALPTELSDGGDAWARFTVRIREILASTHWLREHKIFKELNYLKTLTPLREVRNFKGLNPRIPIAFSEIEAPEGLVKITLSPKKNTSKLQVKVRTPAYFIAQSLPQLLCESDLKDLPLVLYSLGICADEIDK